MTRLIRTKILTHRTKIDQFDHNEVFSESKSDSKKKFNEFQSEGRQ